MSDIVYATLSDSKNSVSAYPEDGIPRDFTDAVFQFTTSVASKSRPYELVERKHEEGDHIFFAMHDINSNFAGFAVKSGSVYDEERDTLTSSLLKDLVFLASVSSQCPKNDEASQIRVTKILAQRCSAGDNSKKIDVANQAAETLRLVAEKRAASSSVSASAAASAAAGGGGGGHDDEHEGGDENNRKKKKKKKSKKSEGEDDEEAEEREEDKRPIEQRRRHMTRQIRPSATGEPLPPKVDAEWKRFQETMQYKVCQGLLVLCGVITVVMFFCSPDLTGCGINGSGSSHLARVNASTTQ